MAWAQPVIARPAKQAEAISSTPTLAAQSRFKPFSERYDLDLQNAVRMAYMARDIRDIAVDGNIRESHIETFNKKPINSGIKLHKKIETGSLRSGKKYALAVFEFTKENKQLKVLLLKDHTSLSVEDREELESFGIKNDADINHLACPGLEGVWFINPAAVLRQAQDGVPSSSKDADPAKTQSIVGASRADFIRIRTEEILKDIFQAKPVVKEGELNQLLTTVTRKYKDLVERFKREAKEVHKDMRFGNPESIYRVYRHPISGCELEPVCLSGAFFHLFRLKQNLLSGVESPSFVISFDAKKDNLMIFDPHRFAEEYKGADLEVLNKTFSQKKELIRIKIVDPASEKFKEEALQIIQNYVKKEYEISLDASPREEGIAWLKGQLEDKRCPKEKKKRYQETMQKLEEEMADLRNRLSREKYILNKLEVMSKERVIAEICGEEKYLFENVISYSDLGLSSPLDLLRSIDEICPVIEQILLTGKPPSENKPSEQVEKPQPPAAIKPQRRDDAALWREDRFLSEFVNNLLFSEPIIKKRLKDKNYIDALRKIVKKDPEASIEKALKGNYGADVKEAVHQLADEFIYYAHYSGKAKDLTWNSLIVLEAAEFFRGVLGRGDIANKIMKLAEGGFISEIDLPVQYDIPIRGHASASRGIHIVKGDAPALIHEIGTMLGLDHKTNEELEGFYNFLKEYGSIEWINKLLEGRAKNLQEKLGREVKKDGKTVLVIGDDLVFRQDLFASQRKDEKPQPPADDVVAMGKSSAPQNDMSQHNTHDITEFFIGDALKYPPGKRPKGYTSIEDMGEIRSLITAIKGSQDKESEIPTSDLIELMLITKYDDVKKALGTLASRHPSELSTLCDELRNKYPAIIATYVSGNESLKKAAEDYLIFIMEYSLDDAYSILLELRKQGGHFSEMLKRKFKAACSGTIDPTAADEPLANEEKEVKEMCDNLRILCGMAEYFEEFKKLTGLADQIYIRAYKLFKIYSRKLGMLKKERLNDILTNEKDKLGKSEKIQIELNDFVRVSDIGMMGLKIARNKKKFKALGIELDNISRSYINICLLKVKWVNAKAELEKFQLSLLDEVDKISYTTAFQEGKTSAGDFDDIARKQNKLPNLAHLSDKVSIVKSNLDEAYLKFAKELYLSAASNSKGSCVKGLITINANEKLRNNAFTKNEFQELSRKQGDPASDRTVYSKLNGLIALGVLEIVNKGITPFNYRLTDNYKTAPPEKERKITVIIKALPDRPTNRQLAIARNKIDNLLRQMILPSIIHRSIYDYTVLLGLANLDPAMLEQALSKALVYVDAGCGIGRACVDAAETYPDLMTYGVDAIEWKKKDIETSAAGSGRVLSWNEFLKKRKQLKEAGKYTFIRGDITTQKFPERADVITSYYVLQYVKDPLSALANLYNQLKVGGQLFATILVPKEGKVYDYYKQFLDNLRSNGKAYAADLFPMHDFTDCREYLIFMGKESEGDADVGLVFKGSKEITVSADDSKINIYSPRYQELAPNTSVEKSDSEGTDIVKQIFDVFGIDLENLQWKQENDGIFKTASVLLENLNRNAIRHAFFLKEETRLDGLLQVVSYKDKPVLLLLPGENNRFINLSKYHSPLFDEWKDQEIIIKAAKSLFSQAEEIRPNTYGYAFLWPDKEEAAIRPSDGRGSGDENAIAFKVYILPGVYLGMRISSTLSASLTYKRAKKGMKVLIMGTGIGLEARIAAMNGADVDAVDIKEMAVANTILTCSQDGIADKVKAFKNDLFNGLGKYDLIIFNMPHILLSDEIDEKKKIGEDELLYDNVADIDASLLNRTAANILPHLNETGTAILINRPSEEVTQVLESNESLSVSMPEEFKWGGYNGSAAFFVSKKPSVEEPQKLTQDIVPMQLESVSETANRIHNENLANPPDVPEKTILCHIIMDSIVPVEQQQMLQVMVKQEMERRAAMREEFRERVVCLSGANTTDPKRFIEDLQGKMQEETKAYNALGYTGVQFDIACPDKNLVNTIFKSNLGVKALAFEPYQGDEFTVIQVEGIMLALRALHSGDIEKLKITFAFLAGNKLSQEQSAITDIDEFIKKVTFILPAVKIEDYNERRKINYLIAENIKQAA